MKTPKLIPFFVLNLALIAASLSFFFPPVIGHPESIAYFLSVAVAAVIIIAQHTAAKRWPKWWQWLLIFYTGMLCFLFILGAGMAQVFSPEESRGLGRSLSSGYFIMFLGQIYGFAILPVVFGVNQLFRRFCPDALAIRKNA